MLSSAQISKLIKDSQINNGTDIKFRNRPMHIVNWFSIEMPWYFHGKWKIIWTNVAGITKYSTERKKWTLTPTSNHTHTHRNWLEIDCRHKHKSHYKTSRWKHEKIGKDFLNRTQKAMLLFWKTEKLNLKTCAQKKICLRK